LPFLANFPSSLLRALERSVATEGFSAMIRYFIESSYGEATREQGSMLFFREKALIKSGVNPLSGF
jgi:hypothetical protein